jgi:enoyl-CoA hydratase/carnithine racemase
MPEVKFGVPAPLFFTGSFLNMMGQRRAEMAVLSGKLYTPDEAKEVGFVDEVAESREGICQIIP